VTKKGDESAQSIAEEDKDASPQVVRTPRSARMAATKEAAREEAQAAAAEATETPKTSKKQSSKKGKAAQQEEGAETIENIMDFIQEGEAPKADAGKKSDGKESAAKETLGEKNKKSVYDMDDEDFADKEEPAPKERIMEKEEITMIGTNTNVYNGPKSKRRLAGGRDEDEEEDEDDEDASAAFIAPDEDGTAVGEIKEDEDEDDEEEDKKPVKKGLKYSEVNQHCYMSYQPLLTPLSFFRRAAASTGSTTSTEVRAQPRSSDDAESVKAVLETIAGSARPAMTSPDSEASSPRGTEIH